MAKPKPSLQGGVIRHEIVLGKVEREMAEHVALTKSINNLMWPVVGAGGVVVSYYGVRAVAGWLGSLGDWMTGPEFVTKKDGTQVENPLHDVPVLGGLFGAGMKAGAATQATGSDEGGGFIASALNFIFSINPNYRKDPVL